MPSGCFYLGRKTTAYHILIFFSGNNFVMKKIKPPTMRHAHSLDPNQQGGTRPYRVLLCVCGQTLRLFRTFPQLCHNAFLMFPCPLFKCELSLFSRSVKTTPWAAQTLFTKADEICVIASHVLLHLLFSSNNYESTRKKSDAIDHPGSSIGQTAIWY